MMMVNAAQCAVFEGGMQAKAEHCSAIEGGQQTQLPYSTALPEWKTATPVPPSAGTPHVAAPAWLFVSH